MPYACKTCGAIAEDPGHLCNPCGEKQGCSFCGTLKVDARHICRDKLGSMEFYCEGCGRLATQSSHLCRPRQIA